VRHKTIVTDNLWHLSKSRHFGAPQKWLPPPNAWSRSATGYYDTIICLKQLLCITIKIPNICRQLVVLCPDVTVTHLKTS